MLFQLENESLGQLCNMVLVPGPSVIQLVNKLRCIKTYVLNALHKQSAEEREGMEYLLNGLQLL